MATITNEHGTFDVSTVYAAGGLECSGEGSRGRVRLGAWQDGEYVASFSADLVVRGGYEWRDGPRGGRVSVPYDGLWAAQMVGTELRAMAARGEPLDAEAAKHLVRQSHGVAWG